MIYKPWGNLYSVQRPNGDLVGVISKENKTLSLYYDYWITLEELKMITDFINILYWNDKR